MNQELDNNYLSWDDQQWRNRFLSAQHPHNHHVIKLFRQMVFFNTTQIVNKRQYISATGKPIELDLNPDIAAQTRFYKKEIHIESCNNFSTKVSVVQADCLEYARKMTTETGKTVCVLNLASATTPGGGVHNGAGAQEEYLFRCSDYYRSLFQYSNFGGVYHIPQADESYPLDWNFGGIFTPNATVFRDIESTGYALIDEPWKVNFIAVAGLNHPTLKNENGETRIADHLVHCLRNKIRTIFRIALDNGQTNLVLGALGCGAFANPPKHVAEIFKEILAEPEFCNQFEQIVFAIKGGPKGGNYQTFKEVIG